MAVPLSAVSWSGSIGVTVEVWFEGDAGGLSNVRSPVVVSAWLCLRVVGIFFLAAPTPNNLERARYVGSPSKDGGRAGVER